MADDHYSRPIRPPHFPAHPHAPQHGSASGGDPLAELARLIGQSADPYRGHPQDGGRQAAGGAYDPHPAYDRSAQWDGAESRFPQHDPYAAHDPYAPDDAYARQDAYAQDAYAQQDAYPQQEPYAPRDPYPQHDPYARETYPDSAYTTGQGYDDPYRDPYQGDAAPRAPHGGDQLYHPAPGYPEPHDDAPAGEARYGGAHYETPQFAAPDYDDKPYPPYDNQYYAQPPAFPAVPQPGHVAAGQMHAPNGHDYAPYADPAYPDAAYADAAYADPNAAYEDAPYYHPQPADGADAPARRRGGLVTVFAVLALAVVGTAGAFAYRSMFAPSGANIAPPVIKADIAPSKIVPAASDSAKPIQDRVGDRAQLERLITREEQPVEVNTARAGAPRVIFPGPNPVAPLPDSPIPPSPNAIATGSAPAANEPKKIRTVTIRSDQPDVAPMSAPAQNPAAAAASGAPLSLSPGGAQPAPQRAAPVRNTAVPAAAVAGGYSVQVTSQRSEGEAQSAFAALQAKFPGVLGGRQAVIRRADLGDKGVYYRAQVPFGSQGEAADFCASLKSAGGQCVIQRN
jgi:hypothetical protein